MMNENTKENRNTLERVIAPNYEERKAIHEKIVNVSYYLIIVLISLILLFLVPLLTGCLYGDIGFAFPKTTEGWILYCIIKIGTALANVGIFVMFKLQAKVNVKTNPNYLKANEILANAVNVKKPIPRSPHQMNKKEYSKKTVTVFLTSLISSIAISALIISFDVITFISCATSTVISIIFGWTTMLKNEVYWTEEYLEYAKYISKGE